MKKNKYNLSYGCQYYECAMDGGEKITGISKEGDNLIIFTSNENDNDDTWKYQKIEVTYGDEDAPSWYANVFELYDIKVYDVGDRGVWRK